MIRLRSSRVQSSSDHGKDGEKDCMEDDSRVCWRPDTNPVIVARCIMEEGRIGGGQSC